MPTMACSTCCTNVSILLVSGLDGRGACNTPLHSTGPFRHHLLVLEPVPHTREVLLGHFHAQAYTLLVLQARRAANDAWRKTQGQKFAPPHATY